MKTRNIIALLALSIFGAVLAGCGTVKSTAPQQVVGQMKETKRVTGSNVGQVAPDFALTTTGGETVSNESLKGNPAVLVFWSYFCADCEEEAPHINKLNEEFKDKGVKVVGINIGESDKRVQGGIRDFGIKYAVAKDEGRKVTQKYGVLGTPTVIFLDKESVVAHKGNELPEDYAAKLKKLL